QEEGASFIGKDRSYGWQLSLQDKDGNYANDATKEVAERIVKEGTLEVEGTKDVLTLALGTPEHGGLVRGIGDGVTPTQYFRLIKRGSKKHNKEEKSRLSETNSEPDFRKVHAKGTSHSLLPNPMLPLGKELSCSLVVGSKSNIVAKGKAYVELGPETKLHNVPLGPNNARVSVDNILEGKDHVALPIPFRNELVILKDALGSQVAWPKHLVLKSIEANSPIPAKNSKKENVEVTSRAPVRNHTLDLGKGRSCNLAVDFKSNVVAKGIVYEELGPETKLHNVPLRQYNSHVAVGKILE
ncbi:hypothetical protein IFM89_018703, partial [Coptis chinensis]